MGNLDPIVPNFQINGVRMPSPTDIKWELPDAWGVNGDGFERLNPYGECVLTWSHIHFDDYTDLRDAFESVTGTAIVKLPTLYGDLNSSSWKTYGGVILTLPRPQGSYFGGYLQNVRMVIKKINPGRATVL